MIEKQNDPQMIEKKVITNPIDYAILNQLSTNFNTQFVPQTESYAEQAFCGDVKKRKVERDVKEIEALNLELDHKEKVLVITALKEQLKGKAILTKVVSLNPINLALLQVDVVLLVPKLRKNRTAHIDYIRYAQEEAATLRELVESERLLSPLNTSLAYVCKYTRRIQELLMILQQTFPSITDLGTNLVAVTPKNKTKQIRHTARIQELLIILQQTCPSITDLGTKLVAVTPKNKTKQIRRTVQITKSERTTVATSPLANTDSNTPVLSSTGVAFRQHTYFIRNLEGVDLLTGIQDQVLALASSLVTLELWCYQSSS
nr:hypothetical protein [Tanacetum cinerariifolium]